MVFHWEDGRLRTSRRLHPLEHLALQGLPPQLALSMTKVDVIRGAGNAFTVPVIGAVLAQLLPACPMSPHRIPSLAVHGGPLDEGRLQKRRRVEALRASIALLQAQSRGAAPAE